MDIEPLKQAALADFTAAADLAALDQSKGAWIGPNGKFTALMKQLGTLPKEERPAAGKLINQAKNELDAASPNAGPNWNSRRRCRRNPRISRFPAAAARSANCTRSLR